MMILGLLGIIQICLLPGLLADCLIKPNTRIIPRLAAIFVISLLMNYLLVIILVSLKIYISAVLYTIVFGECSAIIYLHKSDIIPVFKLSLADITQFSFKNGQSLLISKINEYDKINIIALLCWLSGLILLSHFLTMFCSNIGHVFMGWDSIVSWNRWAVEFYSNKYPIKTYHYPQLLPANWSVIYVIAGYPLQYFPKAVMPLFLIFLIIITFDLASSFRNVSYVIASIGLMFLYMRVFFTNFMDGSADVPVSVISFLSYVFLIYASSDKNTYKQKLSYIAYAAVCASAAGVVKQAGLFTTVFFIILFWILIKKRILILRGSDAKKITILYLLAVLIIDVTIYSYIEWRIHSGADMSELDVFVSQGLYGTFCHFRTVLITLKAFANQVTYSASVIIFITVLISVIKNSMYRYFFMLIALPYFIIWVMFYSYDFRNTSVTIPYLAFGIGYGVGYICQYLIHRPLIAKIRTGYVLLAAAAAFAFVLSLFFSSGRLIENQNNALKYSVLPSLNMKLYEYDRTNHIKGLIATDYQIVGHLPLLSEHYILEHFDFKDDKQYEIYADNKKNPNINYFLFRYDILTERIRSDIDSLIKNGQLKILFQQDGYTFIQIIRKN